MSAPTAVSVADRFTGGAGPLSANISLLGAEQHHGDGGGHRVCMVIDTGCSMAHLRMTQAECERLIEAVQGAVKTFPVTMAEAA